VVWCGMCWIWKAVFYFFRLKYTSKVVSDACAISHKYPMLN